MCPTYNYMAKPTYNFGSSGRKVPKCPVRAV